MVILLDCCLGLYDRVDWNLASHTQLGFRALLSSLDERLGWGWVASPPLSAGPGAALQTPEDSRTRSLPPQQTPGLCLQSGTNTHLGGATGTRVDHVLSSLFYLQLDLQLPL